MAFYRNIELAAKWLAAAQNLDGGWGLTPHQASSLVNTSEAIFVFNMAGAKYSKYAKEGIE